MMYKIQHFCAFFFLRFRLRLLLTLVSSRTARCCQVSLPLHPFPSLFLPSSAHDRRHTHTLLLFLSLFLFLLCTAVFHLFFYVSDSAEKEKEGGGGRRYKKEPRFICDDSTTDGMKVGGGGWSNGEWNSLRKKLIV